MVRSPAEVAGHPCDAAFIGECDLADQSASSLVCSCKRRSAKNSENLHTQTGIREGRGYSTDRVRRSFTANHDLWLWGPGSCETGCTVLWDQNGGSSHSKESASSDSGASSSSNNDHLSTRVIVLLLGSY